jgi:hypothetical protein
MSKHTINMGPGTIVGAMAVGDGARVEGSVTIGGSPTVASPEAIRVKVEIRRMAPWKAATYLRKLADKIDEGKAGTFARGTVTDGAQSNGVAWDVSADR